MPPSQFVLDELVRAGRTGPPRRSSARSPHPLGEVEEVLPRIDPLDQAAWKTGGRPKRLSTHPFSTAPSAELASSIHPRRNRR